MKRTLLVGLISLLSLNACGGGGSSSPVAPVNRNIYPLQTAFNNYLGTAKTYSLSGSYEGKTLDETISLAPQQSQVLGGVTLKSSLETAIVKVNGTLAGQGSATYLTYPQTGYLYGYMAPNDGYNLIVTSGGIFPSTGTVGQTGAFANATAYNSVSNAQIGTLVMNYEVDADSANPNYALLCLDQTSSSTTETATTCYRMDTQGVIHGVLVRLNNQGQTINLQKVKIGS